MSLKWRDFNKNEFPEDGQACLTKMKHGVISGIYVESDQSFRGYYFRDIEWCSDLWIPIEELDD